MNKEQAERRIRQLIKLAQNNDNEFEAKSAMAMAKRLAEKHGILVAELKPEPERMVIDGIENVNRMMNMFGFKAGRTRE